MADITLNLTAEDRRLLVEMRDAVTVGGTYRALFDRILDAFPEPLLEDGIYERPSFIGDARTLVHVHDGLRSSHLDRDGHFPRDHAALLPDDASNWTLVLARTYTDAAMTPH